MFNNNVWRLVVGHAPSKKFFLAGWWHHINSISWKAYFQTSAHCIRVRKHPVGQVSAMDPPGELIALPNSLAHGKGASTLSRNPPPPSAFLSLLPLPIWPLVTISYPLLIVWLTLIVCELCMIMSSSLLLIYWAPRLGAICLYSWFTVLLRWQCDWPHSPALRYQELVGLPIRTYFRV